MNKETGGRRHESEGRRREAEDTRDAGERLQKILSRAGVASRRLAEELIVQGRVQVNGRTVTALGTKADPGADGGSDRFGESAGSPPSCPRCGSRIGPSRSTSRALT